MKTQRDIVRTVVTAGAVVGLLVFALLSRAGSGIDLPGNGGPGISPPQTPVEPTPPAPTPTTGMYARFDGIEGESLDADHKDWIELESMSWGMHKAITGATGQSGETAVEDIVLTKTMDKASPKLAEAVSKGQVIKEVEIHLCASYGGGDSRRFLEYKMQDVIISSYSFRGSAWNDAVPTESMSLNFAKIEETYTQYSASGTSQGQTTYNWDIVENVGR